MGLSSFIRKFYIRKFVIRHSFRAWNVYMLGFEVIRKSRFTYVNRAFEFLFYSALFYLYFLFLFWRDSARFCPPRYIQSQKYRDLSDRYIATGINRTLSAPRYYVLLCVHLNRVWSRNSERLAYGSARTAQRALSRSPKILAIRSRVCLAAFPLFLRVETLSLGDSRFW